MHGCCSVGGAGVTDWLALLTTSCVQRGGGEWVHIFVAELIRLRLSGGSILLHRQQIIIRESQNNRPPLPISQTGGPIKTWKLSGSIDQGPQQNISSRHRGRDKGFEYDPLEQNRHWCAQWVLKIANHGGGTYRLGATDRDP